MYFLPAGAGVTVICQYDQNNCIVDYHVQLNGDTASVYVGEERSKSYLCCIYCGILL